MSKGWKGKVKSTATAVRRRRKLLLTIILPEGYFMDEHKRSGWMDDCSVDTQQCILWFWNQTFGPKVSMKSNLPALKSQGMLSTWAKPRSWAAVVLRLRTPVQTWITFNFQEAFEEFVFITNSLGQYLDNPDIFPLRNYERSMVKLARLPITREINWILLNVTFLPLSMLLTFRVPMPVNVR